MMKKIIPFNNVLEFNTDVKEITAISLEHEIKKYPDMISGVFYISGEYKITEGLLEKEKFNFELPFDIALTNNYELDSLLVDIDDFRYDLVADKNLKVNIDLYIDGEEILEPVRMDNEITDEILFGMDENNENLEDDFINEKLEKDDEELEENIVYNENYPDAIEIKTIPDVLIEPERIDLLKDMLVDDKENTMDDTKNVNIDNVNENININNNNDNGDNLDSNLIDVNKGEEKYVTYRVYKVLDSDTVDSIMAKYKVTKEMLADYNNIENIVPGDKLIIPTNEE